MGFFKHYTIITNFGAILLLTFNINASRITFTAAPPVLKANLTGAASMRCQLSDTKVTRAAVTNTTEDVLHVTSILITMDDGTTQVAHGSAFDAPAGLVDDGNLQVKGEITGTQSEGFLQLTWRTPSLMRMGEYACEVHTLDQHHRLTVFRSTLEMIREDPTINDVVVMLQSQQHMMEDNVARHHAEIADLKKQLQIQAQLNTNQTQLIAKLKTCNNDRSAFMVALEKTMTFTDEHPFVYDKILLNIGNGYDTNTGAFVCKIPGIYYFSVSAVNNKVNNCIQLRLNANDVITSTITYDSGSFEAASMSATVALKLNDKVQVFQRCYSNHPFFTDGNMVYANAFTGHLLHPDSCLA